MQKVRREKKGVKPTHLTNPAGIDKHSKDNREMRDGHKYITNLDNGGRWCRKCVAVK